MGTAKREHTPAFKAQVALAAIRGDRTLSEVAAQYHLHINLVAHWRKLLLANASAAFTPTGQSAPPADPRVAQLFEQIGRLQVELAFVKKKSAG